MPPKKTNAARLLDELGIVYELHEAPYDEADLSATSMARALGVPPEEVFKTLVLRGDRTGVIEACVPAAAELNLKELAAASGNKHVEMVPLKEIQPLTGYIRGGCSPVCPLYGSLPCASLLHLDSESSIFIVSDTWHGFWVLYP